MKKTSRKILALLLTVILAVSVCAPAFAVSEDEWSAYWETADAKSAITVFSGSDESERLLSWYSEEKSEPEVLLGESEDKLDTVFKGTALKASEGDYANKVTISGLKPDTVYYYKCISGKYESAVYSFKTDKKDGSFCALYVTDVHISYYEDDADSIKDSSRVFSQTLENAAAKRPDLSLILSAGDQASLALESEYKGFSASPVLKSVSVATAIGNHDKKGIEYKTFKNVPNEDNTQLVKSYIGSDYWFVKDNALFLVMDSTSGSGVDHRNFVKEAVEKNPDVKWRIMMFHHDLYGEREPHRQTEVKIMELLWSPICDEFAIDLVLLGHSHFFTISNVIYKNRTAEDYKSEMTDPKGTIYFTSGSINRPETATEAPLGKNAGYDYLAPEAMYNLLDFDGDTLTVSSYTQDADEPFNTFSIIKTGENGGHPDKTRNPLDDFVRLIGTVYTFINNFSIYSEIKEAGYNVCLLEWLFG
ncbi:MAG: fibronectin type III domain-containing protein [Acutalibacteraceae bacterium]